MQPYIVKNGTVTIYAVVSIQSIYAAKAYMSDILMNYFFGIKYFLDNSACSIVYFLVTSLRKSDV